MHWQRLTEYLGGLDVASGPIDIFLILLWSWTLSWIYRTVAIVYSMINSLFRWNPVTVLYCIYRWDCCYHPFELCFQIVNCYSLVEIISKQHKQQTVVWTAPSTLPSRIKTSVMYYRGKSRIYQSSSLLLWKKIIACPQLTLCEHCEPVVIQLSSQSGLSGGKTAVEICLSILPTRDTAVTDSPNHCSRSWKSTDCQLRLTSGPEVCS